MSMKKLASAAAVAALFALPLAGHAQQQQSAGTLMSDTAITTKIKAAQAADSTVRATQIDVETDNNGVVTLSGEARSQAEIDRAVQIARGVEGVKSVRNNMRLASTAGTTGTTGTTAGSTGTAGTAGSMNNNTTGSTTTRTTTDTQSTTMPNGGMRAPRSDRG
jgi:hyperosmotically inducible periplasmic protein